MPPHPLISAASTVGFPTLPANRAASDPKDPTARVNEDLGGIEVLVCVERAAIMTGLAGSQLATGAVPDPLHQPAPGAIRARRARRGLGVSGQGVEQRVASRRLVDEELGPPPIGLEAEADRLRTDAPRDNSYFCPQCQS
jgi:hypothetical protein